MLANYTLVLTDLSARYTTFQVSSHNTTQWGFRIQVYVIDESSILCTRRILSLLTLKYNFYVVLQHNFYVLHSGELYELMILTKILFSACVIEGKQNENRSLLNRTCHEVKLLWHARLCCRMYILIHIIYSPFGKKKCRVYYYHYYFVSIKN